MSGRGMRWAMCLWALGMVGCAGNYSGTDRAAGDTTSAATGGAKSVDEFFTQQVQPRLAFCRNCHVPGGIADVDNGRKMMLSPDGSNDLAALRASWELLGGNNPTSRILLMASGQETPHSGGAPWPSDGAAYKDMAVLLNCFENPTDCLAGATTGGVAEQLPLLGSKHAQHVWATYCADKPDNQPLPVDPRTLVRPGYNAGRAVFFNAYYEDCHVNLPDAADAQHPSHPKTCGDYRRERDAGLQFLMDELPSPASPAVTAADFDNSWQKWGLSEKPADFEHLYTLRYGLNTAPFDNPYPLPGEDPNTSNGGTGQLPLGLRQLKDADGKWTGEVGTAACFQCHGGQIGDTADGGDKITLSNLGLGNNNFDVPMNAHDNSPFASTPFAPASSVLPSTDINSLFNIGIKQRGQNNAVGAFEFLITVLDLDSLGINPNPLKTMVEATGPQDEAHPLAHTQDTPPWWNFGSRPRKFFDAGVSNDSTRIIMAAGPGDFNTLVTADGKAYRDRIEQYDQDLATFFLSLRSPDYPQGSCTGADGGPALGDKVGCIDIPLAEQGAILFHTLDLWSRPGNADKPKPLGGNGSCASCHGAYSPRYVNDPNYLQSPQLEGVAAHIVPLDVIDTDHARSDMLTPTLRERWDTTYWGYTDNVDGYVAPENKDYLTESADDMYPVALRPQGVCGWEKDVIGYQAPPLYGVWATAPYFHNGSVPTVEAVLDSSKRAEIWQRPIEVDQATGIKGFDQRLSTAYDFTEMGWKSTALSCSDIPGTEQMNCNPTNDQGPSLSQMMTNYLDSNVAWAGVANEQTDPAPDAIDKRLVFDTRILGNGNGGHTFTDVLTDAERKAIIEYLKTL